MNIKDAVIAKLKDRSLFRDDPVRLNPESAAICEIVEAKLEVFQAEMLAGLAALRHDVEASFRRPLANVLGLESIPGEERYEQE